MYNKNIIYNNLEMQISSYILNIFTYKHDDFVDTKTVGIIYNDYYDYDII